VRRTSRGRRAAASQDVASLGHLYEAADRLRRVQILNRDALELIDSVIRADDRGDYLIYFDPPYLPETRTNRRGYRYETDPVWHAAAAELLRRARGLVVVSAYPSALYEELYEAYGWARHERGFVTNSGGRRIEAVWVKGKGRLGCLLLLTKVEIVVQKEKGLKPNLLRNSIV
jgi:site-specific DNA-adenine methylase